MWRASGNLASIVHRWGAMPRRLLVRNDFFPYHVTARVNNRERFPLPLDQMWSILGHEFLSIDLRFGVETHAAVLMSNHFHAMMTVPFFDLGIVMHTFMRNLTKRVNIRTGRTGHLFGGPYHWSLINGPRYYYHALKYVYRNPVESRAIKRAEDYAYSTLSGLMGRTWLPFPIHYPRSGIDWMLPGREPQDWLKWIRRAPNPNSKLILKKSLLEGVPKMNLEELL